MMSNKTQSDVVLCTFVPKHMASLLTTAIKFVKRDATFRPKRRALQENNGVSLIYDDL